MKHINPSSQISQQKKQKKLFNHVFSELNLEQVVKQVNNLTVIQKKVLAKFLKYFTYYKSVDPSQITLGKEIKCSSKSVWRATEVFEEFDFISKRQRWDTSCKYKLNPIFTNYRLRSLILPILTSLKFIPFAWLLSAYDQVNGSVVELTDKNIIFNINTKNTKESLYVDTPITRTRARGDSDLKKEYTMEMIRKKELLKNFRNDPSKWRGDPVSSAIREMKSIHLELPGQLKMGIFKDQVIEYADAQLLKCKIIPEDPFKWLFKVCCTYSEQHGFPIDWWWYKEWQQLLSLEDSLEFYSLEKTKKLKREWQCISSRPSAGSSATFSKAPEERNNLEEARKIETHLHNQRNSGTLWKGAYIVPNFFFKVLSPEEIQEIMTQVHVDCECRSRTKKC